MRTRNSILLFLLFAFINSFANDIDKIRYYNTKDYTFSYAGYKSYNGVKLERNIYSETGGIGDIAYIEGLNFKDGIIEMDISAGGASVAYIGFIFRMKERYKYETVYFRPTGYEHADGIQYMPSKNEVFDWWNYQGAKYNDAANLPVNDWFHIKAVVEGKDLKIYLNGSDTPAKHQTNLSADLDSGSVGFWLGNSPKAHFANLKVSDLEGNTLYDQNSVEVDYFGLELPGNKAIPFTPDFLASVDKNIMNGVFSPDGKEFLYNIDNLDFNWNTYSVQYDSGKWTSPVKANFFDGYSNMEPFISPDGSRTYLSCNSGGNYDLFFCNNTDSGRSAPVKLPAEINSATMDNFPSISLYNTFIFNRLDVGLHEAKLIDNKFVEIKKIEAPVNISNGYECDPFISPFEDYLIFSADRPGGYGGFDLYISFKNRDGSWRNPKNLGPNINTVNFDWSPYITPDGKHLIYTRYNGSRYKMHWVSADFIDSMRSTNSVPYLQEPLADSSASTYVPFKYRIPSKTFHDDDGFFSLEWTATLRNGDELPEWLNFKNRVLQGTPTEAKSFSIRITATDTAGASVSDVFRLKISETISATKHDNANDIRCYPNPANEIVYIDNTNIDNGKTFDIINISGEVVNSYPSTIRQIDVSSWFPGTYFIYWRRDDISVYKKLIVQ